MRQHPSVHKIPTCVKCGAEQTWVDCWNCDEDGMVEHDCGEDTCCCLNPEPNVSCDICNGDGGYWVCGVCHPKAVEV